MPNFSLAEASLGTVVDLTGLQKGLQAAEAAANKGLKPVESAFESSGRRMGSFLSNAFSFALGGLIAKGVNAVTGSIGGLVDGMISGNATFEKYQAQFTTLLGSASDAKALMTQLADYANITPFELPQVIQASKNLLTFGGSALNTRQNLELVGNAAAATSNDIGEVAFWIGRAYNAIQNGQPFGEAAMRLQEMGILGGDARLQIDKLQATGAKGPQVWAKFAAGLNAPKDAVAKLGQTAEGLKSTFDDTINGMLRKVGAPLFEVYKAKLSDLTAFLNSPRVQGAIDDFAKGLSLGIGGAIDWVSARIGEATGPTGIITRGLEFLGNVKVSIAEPVLSGAGQLWQGLTAAIQPVIQEAGKVVQPVIERVFGGETGGGIDWGKLKEGLTTGIEDLRKKLFDPETGELTTLFKHVADLPEDPEVQQAWARTGASWDKVWQIIFPDSAGGDLGKRINDILENDPLLKNLREGDTWEEKIFGPGGVKAKSIAMADKLNTLAQNTAVLAGEFKSFLSNPLGYLAGKAAQMGPAAPGEINTADIQAAIQRFIDWWNHDPDLIAARQIVSSLQTLFDTGKWFDPEVGTPHTGGGPPPAPPSPVTVPPTPWGYVPPIGQPPANVGNGGAPPPSGTHGGPTININNYGLSSGSVLSALRQAGVR